ncbi:Mitochondrial presequence protease [Arthrobotrys musiformis]|uniref:Presequence protease, mitochondrial n=2 Tax=Arthrobotrys musiformis TaxID=47236 RepID=A0AAV9WN44_9PEZI
MLRAARPLSRRPLPLARRFLATPASPIDTSNLSSLPEPGLKLKGFTLQRTKHVPELELSALQFKHDKTGAEYLHVAREDSNNVFAIGFKTNPPDATGLPHILEHTTLCGSKKYPVRDPFFKMLNRSLSNYMNAFTASDHTIYPFATTNQTDYMNLMDVYLDATLFPLLQETDFKQEGWRLGPENPQDKESPILFKGVVYNEMKGQMSDRGYLFYKRFQDHLIPALNNSGGDPAFIPDLTLEQLRNFHKDHYHPSNSKIFSYGNFSMEPTLEKLDEKLTHFDQISIDTDLKVPITIDKPIEVTVEGPVDRLSSETEQIITSLSWITCDTTDVVENFGLLVLSSLLLDGYGSPLYKALIERNIGGAYSPNTGYDAGNAKGIFTIGLQNVKTENEKLVAKEILDELHKVRQNGFDKQKVDGILHQLEISLKHKTANFGMSLMHRLQPSWFNGIDPFDTLKWNEIVAQFREQYGKGDYLEGLIEKYLLNGKTFSFTMLPSPNYEEGLEQAESQRLQERVEGLGGLEKATELLGAEELELTEVQEKAKSQDASCLPTLHVKDIPRAVDKVDFRLNKIQDVDVQWRIAPTNGLTYFRAYVKLDGYLNAEQRMHLPLYAAALFRLGTARKTMEEIEDRIKLKTGGISCSPYISTDPSNLEQHYEGLVFAGYCLDSNVAEMLELLRTVIVETSFGRISKLHNLVKGMASGGMDEVAERGHAYAQGLASSYLTNASAASEYIGGISQVKLIADLASSEMYFGAVKHIEQIGLIPQQRGNDMRIAITCGQEAVADNEMHVRKYLDGLVSGRLEPSQKEFEALEIDQKKTFVPMPFQVNYSGVALKTVPFVHKDTAALSVLAKMLTHKHLHHEIREKGGAYGGGASNSWRTGLFRFYSYRDPNPLNTLQVVRESGQVAVDKDWTERDLEEAKLSLFQDIDAPRSVNQEGMSNFLDGVTEEMKAAKREEVLDTTVDDVRKVAQKYIVEQFDQKLDSTVVIGDINSASKAGLFEDNDESWNTYDMGGSSKAPSKQAKVML